MTSIDQEDAHLCVELTEEEEALLLRLAHEQGISTEELIHNILQKMMNGNDH